MKKRIWISLCLCAVILCTLFAGTAASAATPRYQVGYAIRDINPWVDPTDHSKGVLPVELSGNGNNWERACTGFMDDNDDGVVGEGDGLYTTATAVTDPYGKTIIYITIDSLQGYETLTKDVKAAIVEKLGSSVVVANQIFVNANHTHSGPAFDSLKSSKVSGFKEYYSYTVSQITDAAAAAYADRAEAVMTKGSIDAKDSTAYLGYNSGNGYHMNAIRHYDVTSVSKTDSSVVKQHVAGSNFGGMTTTMSGYKQTARTNALESDNTMHLLRFTFPNNSEKQPILWVNWRAHSTGNSGGTTKTLFSSDYANSLRANLLKAGYRAAFMQGASGNVVTESTVVQDWTTECSDGKRDLNVYGRILSEIALDCVKRNITNELPAGKIRNIQWTYHGEKQQDSEGLLAAAKAYKDGSAALGENQFLPIPYAYQHTDGKTYVINSKFHANTIVTRSTASSSYTDLELNAIVMGDNVAFVTAPNELADRYDINGSPKNEDNDWLDLINASTYGTPFVMGYTNGSRGYMPFSLEYDYNSDKYYEITGKGANGDEFFSPGSYEANTTRFAQGTGEDIIQDYKAKLQILGEGYYTATCQACDKDVEWTPIVAEQASIQYLGTGHYYLVEDLPEIEGIKNQKIIQNGETLCLDLHGNKSEIFGRSFNVQNGATLNIMDTVGGGKAISYSGGNNVGGGVASVVSGGTINIYGGTLQFIRRDLEESVVETSNGGVVSVGGTLNVYGGTLIGGEMTKSKYYADTSTTNGCGATIFVNTSGKVNLYGGTITAGKAAPGAVGDCIYLAGSGSRVKISGNAKVDEIYAMYNTGVQTTISGTYTGSVAFNFDPDTVSIAAGTDIGNLSSANISNAKLTCVSHPQYTIAASGTNLVTKTRTNTRAVIQKDGNITTYSTLSAAISAYDSGLIVLTGDVTTAVSVNKDVYLDLNGYDITGKVTVASGKTLYCMDSTTDDYSASDDYGKLTNISGTVAGLPESSELAADGYLKITENGVTSFHRVNLRLTAMSLRVEDAGVYYKSNFAADEVVARNVKQFGVVLSVKAEPTAENFDTHCKASVFTGFAAGKNATNTSTLLKNIVKVENALLANNHNANLPIYGRPYVLTNEGEYLFGAVANRSLKEQMVAASARWTTLTDEQKNALVNFYRVYPDVMGKWDMPNLISGIKAQNKLPITDGKTLKILAITSSFGLNTTEHLYDIAVAEGYTEVVVGRLYASGCTLERHVDWMRTGEAGYEYTKNNDGTWVKTEGVTLLEGLQDENWDIIFMQQSAAQSPIASTYKTYVGQLMRYVNQNKTNPNARFVWNMTWAYQSDSTQSVFVNTFKKDQALMYQTIVDVLKEQIVPKIEFNKIIPTGTAIQNARTSWFGDTLTKDTYHLNNLGRVIAGYTLLATLEGESLTEINLETVSSYDISGSLTLTDDQKAVIIEVVNAALASPYKVTASNLTTEP